MLEDTLYEVDQATYYKINVDPYVQSVQHLNPMMLAENGNLIPSFNLTSIA